MQFWKNTNTVTEELTHTMLLTPEDLHRLPAGTRLIEVSGDVVTYMGEEFSADHTVNGYTPYSLLIVVEDTDTVEATAEVHAEAKAQLERVTTGAEEFAHAASDIVNERFGDVIDRLAEKIGDVIGVSAIDNIASLLTDEDGKCLVCDEVHPKS